MKEEDCKRLVQSSNKKLRKKTRSQFSDQWKQMSFEDRLKAMGQQNESVAQQYVELPMFDSIKKKAIIHLGILEKTKNKDLEEKKINIEKFEEDDNQKVEVEKKSKKSETTPLTTKQQNKLNKKKKNKAIGK